MRRKGYKRGTNEIRNKVSSPVTVPSVDLDHPRSNSLGAGRMPDAVADLDTRVNCRAMPIVPCLARRCSLPIRLDRRGRLDCERQIGVGGLAGEPSTLKPLFHKTRVAISRPACVGRNNTVKTHSPFNESSLAN